MLHRRFVGNIILGIVQNQSKSWMVFVFVCVTLVNHQYTCVRDRDREVQEVHMATMV